MRGKLILRIKNVILLIAFSAIVYFLLYSIIHIDNLVDYWSSVINYKSILTLLLINVPIVNNPTWFLFAMLYSYIIIYIFSGFFLKYRCVKVFLSSMLIIIILFRIIVSILDVSIFAIKLSSHTLYYSWYANGLPFISFGMLLKEKEEKLKRINTSYILVIMVLSGISMACAHFLCVKHECNISFYLGNIIFVAMIFALSSKKPDLFSNLKITTIKGNWTMFVYILHPAIIIIVSYLLKHINMNDIVRSWITPIMVILITVCVSLVLNYILEKTKELKKKYNNV